MSHTALHSGHMTQLYDSYVRSRTLANWKFWIVSFLFTVTLIVFLYQISWYLVIFGWAVTDPSYNKTRSSATANRFFNVPVSMRESRPPPAI